MLPLALPPLLIRRSADAMTYIYALLDPNTDAIRYVGKTSREVEKRFAEHISEARAGLEHSPKSKHKMSIAAKARLARGDSPLCSRKHQQMASAKSTKGKGRKIGPTELLAMSERAKLQWAERERIARA